MKRFQIKLEDLLQFNASRSIASETSDLNGRPLDLSVIVVCGKDLAQSDVHYLVSEGYYNEQRTVIYKGTDLAKAIEAFNELAK